MGAAAGVAGWVMQKGFCMRSRAPGRGIRGTEVVGIPRCFRLPSRIAVEMQYRHAYPRGYCRVGRSS